MGGALEGDNKGGKFHNGSKGRRRGEGRGGRSGGILNSPAERRQRRECVTMLTERSKKLLELFTQWDWSAYLADYGKPSCKYLRVNPHTALVLLEKMRETSRKNNVFAQFRKLDRDRQKLIDTIIKQLRSLIAQHRI